MFVSQFETEERSFRNKKTSAAVFVTTLIHGLILLFLIMVMLYPPNPPYEESAGGMSVNFGTDASGMGDVQPFTYNPGPTPSSTPSKSVASTVSASDPEQALTDDKSESDVVAKKNDDKPKVKTHKTEVAKPVNKPDQQKAQKANTPVVNPTPQPQVDKNDLFTKGAQGKPNNSKGDGTGNKAGDQGDPNGDPNSRDYQGKGHGHGDGPGTGDLHGPSVSLRGRSNVGLPKPTGCSSTGKVVVEISVNRNGSVVDAQVKSLGSTVFDDCNKNNALNAARNARFNADPNAAEIQKGTITYTYTLK